MSELQRPRVNFSWSLDTSATSAVTFGTNLLRACTSDNVQPMALEACERFGASLAMCLETRLKMEALGKQRHTSRFFKHLKLTIGYVPGDSADYLASSDAGVRFLGLAAALITIGTSFDAAKILHTMLDEFSPKDQLLPTLRQLKDLLEALEVKIACSGFAENLLGWRMWLRSREETSELYQFRSNPPTSGLLVDIVRAMAEMDRLGEADFLLLSISAELVSWITTFVKWCLGTPPSLYHAAGILNHPGDMFNQPGSKVQIEVVSAPAISRSSSGIATLQCFKAFADVRSLLWEGTHVSILFSPQWRGMVRPRTYFRSRLQELVDLRLTSHKVTDIILFLTEKLGDSFLTKIPADSFLGESPSPSRNSLLQLVKAMLLNPGSKAPHIDSNRFQSAWDLVRDKGSFIEFFTDLLILSVIENAHQADETDFWIYCSTIPDDKARKTVRKYIEYTLEKLDMSPLGHINIARCILNAAMAFTGAYLDDEDDEIRFVSSARGQIVYWALLDSMMPDATWPVRLRVASGALRFAGQDYKYANCDMRQAPMVGAIEPLRDGDFSLFPEAFGSLPLIPSQWYCTERDNNGLSIFATIDLGSGVPLLGNISASKMNDLISIQNCQASCPPLTKYVNDLLYCRTIGASLSYLPKATLRHLSCRSRGKDYTFFAYNALAGQTIFIASKRHLKYDDPQELSIAFVRSGACLSCTCATAQAIIEKLTFHLKEGEFNVRAVILD